MKTAYFGVKHFNRMGRRQVLKQTRDDIIHRIVTNHAQPVGEFLGQGSKDMISPPDEITETQFPILRHQQQSEFGAVGHAHGDGTQEEQGCQNEGQSNSAEQS